MINLSILFTFFKTIAIENQINCVCNECTYGSNGQPTLFLLVTNYRLYLHISQQTALWSAVSYKQNAPCLQKPKQLTNLPKSLLGIGVPSVSKSSGSSMDIQTLFMPLR